LDDPVTQPPIETGSTEDPDKAELAKLRQEKADREKAAADEREAELAELREFKAKAEREPAVKAPVKKAEKAEETPPTVKTEETPPPAKRKSLWWND
jgi:hypothetical protein